MQVGLRADLTAYVMQRSARRTARYGDDLYFAADRLASAGVEVVHRVVSGADRYFLDGDRTRARSLLDLVVGELGELRRRLGAVERS